MTQKVSSRRKAIHDVFEEQNALQKHHIFPSFTGIPKSQNIMEMKNRVQWTAVGE
jgi:hypothetical protein